MYFWIFKSLNYISGDIAIEVNEALQTVEVSIFSIWKEYDWVVEQIHVLTVESMAIMHSFSLI